MDDKPDSGVPGSDDLRYALRRRVLRALEVSQSLSELATKVEATDARVQWHLHQLEANGLVARNDAGDWMRTVDGTQALLTDRSSEPGRAFPPRVIDDYEDALLEAAEGLFGADIVQAGGEHRTRLSTAEAAEFRDRLQGLVVEYFAPGQGDRSGVKYGFHWVLTPIDLHPLSDD